MLLTNGSFASSGRHWNSTSYWKKSTFCCCRRPTSIPATSISAMCHGTAISRWVAIVTAYLKPCVVSAIEFTAYYFYSLTVHWFDASIGNPMGQCLEYLIQTVVHGQNQNDNRFISCLVKQRKTQCAIFSVSKSAISISKLTNHSPTGPKFLDHVISIGHSIRPFSISTGKINN